MATPTLPPARHTSCFLVGNREMLVVDPGSPDPKEQARLLSFIARLEAEGRRVVALAPTHHHADHVGALDALRRRLKVPVWAHPATAERLGGADRFLADGEVLSLAGDPPMRLEVLHTPGHAPGHLCFLEPHSRALLCGDMVSGASTVVIDPPEGNLAAYLASLRRLAALGPRTLHPAHGSTVVDGPARLAGLLAHRAWREERIHEALSGGPLSLEEVVARAYDDTPRTLHVLAARSALATLEKLVAEGRARQEGARFLGT